MLLFVHVKVKMFFSCDMLLSGACKMLSATTVRNKAARSDRCGVEQAQTSCAHVRTKLCQKMIQKIPTHPHGVTRKRSQYG